MQNPHYTQMHDPIIGHTNQGVTIVAAIPFPSVNGNPHVLKYVVLGVHEYKLRDYEQTKFITWHATYHPEENRWQFDWGRYFEGPAFGETAKEKVERYRKAVKNMYERWAEWGTE